LAEQKKTVRKTTVGKITAAAKKPAAPRKKPTVSRKKKTAPTYDEIATRAYFIHLEGTGGGELENWLRAEGELATR
jgi:hypothetical protein